MHQFLTKFETKLTIVKRSNLMDGIRGKIKMRKIKLEWMVLAVASALAILVKFGILTFIPW